MGGGSLRYLFVHSRTTLACHASSSHAISSISISSQPEQPNPTSADRFILIVTSASPHLPTYLPSYRMPTPTPISPTSTKVLILAGGESSTNSCSSVASRLIMPTKRAKKTTYNDSTLESVRQNFFRMISTKVLPPPRGSETGPGNNYLLTLVCIHATPHE